MEKMFKRAEDKHILDYVVYADSDAVLCYDKDCEEPIPIEDAEYVLTRMPLIYTESSGTVTYYSIGSFSIDEEVATVTCGSSTFTIGEVEPGPEPGPVV